MWHMCQNQFWFFRLDDTNKNGEYFTASCAIYNKYVNFTKYVSLLWSYINHYVPNSVLNYDIQIFKFDFFIHIMQKMAISLFCIIAVKMVYIKAFCNKQLIQNTNICYIHCFYILQIGKGASNASLWVRAIAGPPQELEFGPVGPINSSI